MALLGDHFGIYYTCTENCSKMEIPGIGLADEAVSSSTFGQISTKLNEASKRKHFKVVRFMFLSGRKLHMSPIPLASAAEIYHRVFLDCKPDHFDPYLIGTTALYLAGKVEEEHLRLRDVINVTYRTLHPDKPPLDIGATYWSLRETVAQCELFIMRALRFSVSFTHPHKYLLHYIKSLRDWLPPELSSTIPFHRTVWALLQDSYHDNLCIRYPPQQMALSVLYLALQIHGLSVPNSQHSGQPWWQALVEDVNLFRIRHIVSELIDLYHVETTAASMKSVSDET